MLTRTGRLCLVYRVVNMLVYFEPASLCNLQPDLVIAPLPARRQLWEASDYLTWKEEADREFQSVLGLATNGELVRLDEGEASRGSPLLLLHDSIYNRTSSRRTASWEEWCSGMDGMGGLVMLAASLIEWLPVYPI